MPPTRQDLEDEADALRREMRTAKGQGPAIVRAKRDELLSRVEEALGRFWEYANQGVQRNREAREVNPALASTDADIYYCGLPKTFEESIHRFKEATDPALQAAAVAEAAAAKAAAAKAAAAKAAAAEAAAAKAAEDAEIVRELEELRQRAAAAEADRERLRREAQVEASRCALAEAEAKAAAAKAEEEAKARADAQAQAQEEAEKRAKAEAHAKEEATARARAEAEAAEASRKKASFRAAADLVRPESVLAGTAGASSSTGGGDGSSSGLGGSGLGGSGLTLEQRRRIEMNREEALRKKRQRMGIQTMPPQPPMGMPAMPPEPPMGVPAMPPEPPMGVFTQEVEAFERDDMLTEEQKRQEKRKEQMRNVGMEIEKTLLEEGRSRYALPPNGEYTLGQLLNELKSRGMERDEGELFQQLKNVCRWRNQASHAETAPLPSDDEMTQTLRNVNGLLYLWCKKEHAAPGTRAPLPPQQLPPPLTRPLQRLPAMHSPRR
jgi:hypothetical protein